MMGRETLTAFLRQWWHRHFAARWCADPACAYHGDDPWTLYTGDGSDL